MHDFLSSFLLAQKIGKNLVHKHMCSVNIVFHTSFLFPFFSHWKACNELCRGRVTKLLRLSEQPVTHLLPEAQRFLPGDAQRENPTVRAMGLLDKHVS